MTPTKRRRCKVLSVRGGLAWSLVRVACRLLEGNTTRWVILNVRRRPNSKGPRRGRISPFLALDATARLTPEFTLKDARRLPSMGVPVPAAVAQLAGWTPVDPHA